MTLKEYIRKRKNALGRVFRGKDNTWEKEGAKLREPKHASQLTDKKVSKSFRFSFTNLFSRRK
jgi:hypothetical protein